MKKGIKYVIAIFMSFVMSVGCLPLNVKASTPQEQDNTPGILEDDDFETPKEYEEYLSRLHTTGNYTYKIIVKNGTQSHVRLYKYNGMEDDIKVPSVIRTLKVRTIAEGTFKNIKTAKTIHIAESIETISSGAFDGCTAKIVKPYYLKKLKTGSYRAYATVRIPRKGRDKQVNYKASKVSKITTSDKSLKVKKGKKKKIYTRIYVSGKKKTGYLSYKILKFTSMNKKIATVSKYGNIKGIKKGTTTIKVTLRTTGKSYKIRVRTIK